MKKITLLLAACAFATASFAQTTPTTEVTVRDNGSKKIVTEHGNTKTVTKTGKTNVGQILSNSTDAAGNVAKKTGRKIKSGSQKASRKAARSTKEMENKSAN